MPRDVFEAALAICLDRSYNIALGGGEPLLHPDWWEYFGRALATNIESEAEIPLFVATNGSQTDKAIALAAMGHSGVVYAVLSQDPWHDPIDKRVIEAFAVLKSKGHEGIRNNEERITPHGSALTNRLYTYLPGTECCCEQMLVHPNGTIFGCGCRKVHFGTVFDPQIPEDFENHTCAVQWKKEQEEMEDDAPTCAC